QFAYASDVWDTQIFRIVDTANEVADHAERAGGDHHRHDREAVEAVSEVYGIAEADDHNHRKNGVETQNLNAPALKERQRNRRERIARPQRVPEAHDVVRLPWRRRDPFSGEHGDGGDSGDAEFEQQT